jgi:2-polyprenyl-3-methyl-5-hydroxy-6-metoxy-1,4-benzoquinol methylase
MKTSWSKKVPFLSKYWTKRGIPEYRDFMIKKITELLEKNPHWKILDAGCGTGLMFNYLPEWAKENYTGIDFTPEMIEYCKKNYPEYSDRFFSGSILESGIIPSSDIIATQNVIQHILLYQQALKNLVEKTRNILILCERTHSEPTIIFGYDPVRWRFREEDMLECLQFYGDKYGFNVPKVIAHPKSTENLENVIAIYMMVKR